MRFGGLRCRPAYRRLMLAAATVAFIGWIPHRIVPFRKWKGGGLLGTLAGWGLVWAFDGTATSYAVVGALLTAFAVWVSHEAERWLGHDDPRIVIDEVAGVWLACAGLPRAVGPMTAALVLFRLFDVWKGPWARRPSRWPGGWGIVADDLAAGLLANLGARLWAAF